MDETGDLDDGNDDLFDFDEENLQNKKKNEPPLVANEEFRKPQSKISTEVVKKKRQLEYDDEVETLTRFAKF